MKCAHASSQYRTEGDTEFRLRRNEDAVTLSDNAR